MHLKHALALAAVSCAAALAACGDDDDKDTAGGGGDSASAPAKLSITSTSSTLKVDGKPKPGVTEITLDNQGKKDASVQLLRIEGDHSEKEVLAMTKKVTDGGPIPDWFRIDGGVATTKGGETGTVTQELAEGKYYAFNDEQDGLKKGSYTAFEVAGEAGQAELPEGQPVTAVDYKFKAPTLKAGEGPIVFENAGKQPHHIVALPLNPGKTGADALKFFKTEKGKPPFKEEGSLTTTVIDGGKTIVADVQFEKAGKYALACFIQDRKGGPPHITKGMVSEVTVK